MIFSNKQQFVVLLDDAPISSKYFLNLFKRKVKAPRFANALSAEDLKKQIEETGKGAKVNITRMTYDGTPEDKPITVVIVDIRSDHFTGKVVNVERSIKQAEDDHVVYVKGGGGSIDFYYEDGDIVTVEKDIDQSVMEQRNIEEIKEILDALDLNEDIIVSYYDDSEGGVINGVGVLTNKNMETMDFAVTFSMINEIELAKPREINLNLNKNKIVDLEVVL